MTPEELAALVRESLLESIAAGDIEVSADLVPETVTVERPRMREHGDWSTNIAMRLSKGAGVPPRQLAEILAARLGEAEGVDAVEVAGPGFINIHLSAESAGTLAGAILESGDDYGDNDSMAGIHVNLEYVSANPTGPVHLGGARWAAYGDALARIMKASGAKVTREYYFNDHGVQIDRFAESLLARARGDEVPEDGYGGDYIGEIASRVISGEIEAGRPDPLSLPEDEAVAVFHKRGVDLMFTEIKNQLSDFRSEFDVFFHEDSLHESGAVNRAIDVLRDRGVIYEEDGAVWLRSTEYGDDKDRVLIKSNGESTYFSADVAYYLDKRDRGADVAIYMLGADHHGYVGRLMSVCAAFGDEPGVNMQVIIGQFVSLLRGGEPVRMSKRAGTVVVLDDLVDAVGVDAARYSLIRVSADTPLTIDLDVLAARTSDNPVYYLQYAYARTRSVSRNAEKHGVVLGDGYRPELLDSPSDKELLGVLAQFPVTVAQSAELREPHRVARYLENVAAAYHAWYSKNRVTPRADEEVTDAHVARLWLNEATAQVLHNGLDLVGVSAPERM